jgi:hypothetical protein
MPLLSSEPSSTLVIVGMHRSGTSLTASALQQAGLHIGQRLMGANDSNVKGHYENLDFFNFHQAVLRSQGVSEDGWTLQERIEVEEPFIDLAEQVVEQCAVSRLWGWKDPRTTLFLDFWSQRLPQAKFLLVYRSPWEVVDSLYRRGTDRVLLEQPELALKMWLHYNRKILHFYNQAVDRCFLVNIATLVSDFSGCVAALNQKFGVDLVVPESMDYDPALFHRLEPNGHRASLVACYFPEAIEMYQELEARAWQAGEELDTSWGEQLQSSPYRVWAFQDWLTVGNLQGENLKLQEELDRAKVELQRTQEELSQERSQLQQVQEQLGQTQAQLHETEEVLEQSMAQLHETEEVLEQSMAQLQQKTEEFNQTQAQLHETEEVLEQSVAQLHETEEVLEQSVAQLQQKTEELNQSQAQLHEAQEELERSQAQLDYIQERTNYQKAIAGKADGNTQVQYKLLLWDGWYAYLQGDLTKMSECLQQSLRYTSLSRTQTISNWLEAFGSFAVCQGSTQLNVQELTRSGEWQQLMHRVTTARFSMAKFHQ